MRWNFWSDWLPLENAIAQVENWELDLKYAEEWLAIMDKLSRKNSYSGFKKQHQAARDDVKHSKKELAKAKVKLEESKKLEEQGRT